MRQCPDCEEKDRVVIAGKVFCANCGTPWTPVNTAEESPYLAKVGLGAPAVAAQPPMPAQAPAPAQAQNQAPVLSAMPAPVVTPPAPPAPAPVSQAPVAQPTQPIAPVSMPVQPQAQAAPPMMPPAPAPAPMPMAQSLKEDIGSEIPSLDGKGETIFSDAEFKQLAQTSSPAPAPAPAPAPSAVPVSAAPPAAPSPQPAQVASQPQPNPAPVPAPPVPPVAPQVPIPTPVAPPPPLPTPPMPPAAPTPQPQSVPPLVQTVMPTMSTGPVDGIVRPANVPPTSPAPAPVAASAPSATTMSPEEAFNLALAADVKPTPPANSGPARPIALVMSVIALTLIGAYLWQSNSASFALKLAGVRSGIAVAAPSYVPSGWKVDKGISVGEGSVTYKLTSNDKSLNVLQKKTDWDAQAVQEQFVTPRTNDYLAIQAQGLTIYVYGKNEAAWVNHGTFYHIDGDHGLSQEDIIKISTSL